jgi:transcriptional regulator with XRE-family HTH domain
MASAVTQTIDDLRERGGLKGLDVANVAAVSPATVSRWSSGEARPHPKTQLLISDLRYIVDRLGRILRPRRGSPVALFETSPAEWGVGDRPDP